jgi:hypothetical protein
MRDRWSTGDYEVLFANHPPTQARAPTIVEARRIADRLRRSTGAVRTQWDDARSLVLGNPTAASFDLRCFIAERWSAEERAVDPLLLESPSGQLR